MFLVKVREVRDQDTSLSYINPDFRLADYSACHLVSHWFLADLFFDPKD
jgi:hypothetical protein